MKLVKLAAVFTALALMCAAAPALAGDTVFEGSVTATGAHQVFAIAGGTVASVPVLQGQHIAAGAPIITLKTDTLYATVDGTVTGVFAQSGDSAAEIGARYGGVMFIEPAAKYIINASIDNAYNSTRTKLVHVGEHVYLSCYSDGDHTGEGRVIAVNGSAFTVEVTDGAFLTGETVSVFRTSSHRSSSRIGRGPLTRNNPVAVTAQGSVVSILVNDGDSVKRGDALATLISGNYVSPLQSTVNTLSPVAGTVASISAQPGQTVAAGAPIAEIYPDGGMRIEALVDEADLAALAPGAEAQIAFSFNSDDDVVYNGKIAMISQLAESGADGVRYRVYIDFTPGSDIRYGMTAVITVPDNDED